MTFKLLCAAALLAAGPALLAGGAWQFQVLHTAKATGANEDMLWSVGFEKPTDKAVVRYRVFVASSQVTGDADTNGQTEKALPANGEVTIPKYGTVVFTYDRDKCSMVAVNRGISFTVSDSNGRSAKYKLEKTPTGDPAKISFSGSAAQAGRLKGVLTLTPGSRSNTGFTTIGILKDALPE